MNAFFQAVLDGWHSLAPWTIPTLKMIGMVAYGVAVLGGILLFFYLLVRCMVKYLSG